MFCIHCGTKLDDDALFCTQCGAAVLPNRQPAPVKERGRIGFGILGFLLPVVGLILFIVWHRQKPQRAKACGIGALIMACCAALAGIAAGIALSIPEEKPPSALYPPPTETPVYEDTPDGVLTFQEYGRGASLRYDAATDSLIRWNRAGIEILDRTTGSARQTFTFEQNISAADVYGGLLCVGFGESSKQIAVCDLNTGEQYLYDTPIYVGEIAVTDGMAVFCDSDQWCSLYAMDLQTPSDASFDLIFTTIYRPKIAINHEDRMLYAVETGVSSCDFYYFDLYSFSAQSHAEFGEYEYNQNGVYYDGFYVHAFGNTFDAITGEKVAACGFAEKIDTDLPLRETLCRSDRYALIATNDCRTVVFDLQNGDIARVLSLTAERIYNVGGGKFIAACPSERYIAYVDLNLL